jgi:hypothetical protein
MSRGGICEGNVFQDPLASFGNPASVLRQGKRPIIAKTGKKILKNVSLADSTPAAWLADA